jgi:hypothetical protein
MAIAPSPQLVERPRSALLLLKKQRSPSAKSKERSLNPFPRNISKSNRIFTSNITCDQAPALQSTKK